MLTHEQNTFLQQARQQRTMELIANSRVERVQRDAKIAALEVKLGLDPGELAAVLG